MGSRSAWGPDARGRRCAARNLRGPRLPIAVVLLVLGVFGVLGVLPSQAFAQSARRAIAGDIPATVGQGRAALLGHHDPASVLAINVGLRVRDSAGLDALIRAASTPGSPTYGRYLTNAQYIATHAPTRAAVGGVKAWLASQGLDVTGVSPDNLLVSVRARTADAERAFGVTINDYRLGNRTFHANAREPSTPGDLGVSWVSGLANFDLYHPNVTGGGLDSGDFRKAYDISGGGSGQTIGLTLWGRQLTQSDFDGYATATGTTKLTIGQAGNDGLDYVAVDGASTISNTDTEVALDTEVAHSVASASHLTYYLGTNNSGTTLEDVVNKAANSGLKIISNSWGCEGCGVDANDESSFQHAASVGTTFVFSTGDNGASGKNGAGPQYPALSQYVLAVGGTNLNLDSSSNWSSETGWSGSGAGCINAEPRPPWQTGIGTALTFGTPSTTCTGRAMPDVAADAGTCAYIYVDGGGLCATGTSLAAPLWAAMSTIWNNTNAASGRPGIGFAPPLVYTLANDATAYGRDFHDITSGNNGFAAGTGWDEVTGWGSPDFTKLSNNPVDITYTGPTSASHGNTITLSGTLVEHGGGALSGRTVYFAAAGESCSATTDASGDASCPVTINDSPGHYSVIAAFGGDAAFTAASVTQTFTVLHIPTTVVYTGAASGDYNDPVTLSAWLTENSDGAPVAGETLGFSLGAETCTATTDTNGNASCSVTPSDTPGSYTVSVSFMGDPPTYESSSTAAAFTLKQEESKLTYTGAVTSHYHDVVSASATLTDPVGGAAIAGKPITFTLGAGDTCSATTDASGDASCQLTPHQTGSQSIVATFAGDTDYVSSSDTKSFAISAEETTMTYTGPTVILAGAAGATLTATLVEDGNTDTDGDGGAPGPVPAQTVTLGIGTQTCTGTTDSSGNVQCTISSVNVPLGPEVVSASFSGNAFYQASSSTRPAIVFAFPSRGAFTLGDETVAAAGPTATVTWWADEWSSLNSLSGGAAPFAFKGFAETITTLPRTTPADRCGTTFTSTGGNSPPPTSGVPSYMGVLAASKVTKSGRTVDGRFTRIVVVKTDPGYAPDPMDRGTGTIVATFC